MFFLCCWSLKPIVVSSIRDHEGRDVKAARASALTQTLKSLENRTTLDTIISEYLLELVMFGSTRRLRLIFSMCLLLALLGLSAGCSDDSSGNGGKTRDTGSVTDTSTATDAMVDAPADTGTDAPTDIGVDAPADIGVDAPADIGVDAPADIGVDAPADIGVDAPADAGGLGPDQCRNMNDCTSGGMTCLAPGESVGCGICRHPTPSEACNTDADCTGGQILRARRP